MCQSFQSFQSFLAFLFACLTFYTVAKVFGLDHLFDPLRDLWKRLSKTGRVLTTVSVVFLAGYAISKERGLRNPEPTLPDWFIALNYNATDTDGDGIPDCWERWTRTNPFVADADQDGDGDGVDNFGEFWNQCDPLMKDTDGDGYSDKLEIEGKAAGKPWFDPIVRASYDYNDPDCNTNGVPDRWEGLGYVYGYTDANSDGYPDGVSFAPEGNGNFDVEVIVSTTRAALLSWGTSTNEAIVLPPCSCLPIRLRLSGLTDADVRLSCGTAGDGSEGLWYGRLVIRWPEGSGRETEGNRIRIEADSVIDCDAMEVSFRGEVQTEPTRTPGGDVPTSITSPFRRRWLYLNLLDGGCWEHNPGGWWAEAIYTNLAPPFAWYVNEIPVPSATGDGFPGGDIHSYWNGETPVVVRCEWTNGPPHNLIKLEATSTVGMRHCPPSVTNIIGAASTSTHNPTNASDHLPYTTNSLAFHCTPNCPETIRRTYCVGWDHGKVNTRNLPVISTSDWRDALTDHCLAIEWNKSLSIDLASYLNDDALEVIDKLHFTVNGSTVARNYHVRGEPRERAPIILHVQVFAEEGDALDSLWIVVYKPSDKTWFDAWYAEQSTNLTWTASLAKPCHSLTFSGGKALAGTGMTGTWSVPEAMASDSYMHHNAVYEMRTNMADTHGNQSMFDETGAIITSGIRAGTADFYAPYDEDGDLRWSFNHRNFDVYPYIIALQFDGNPTPPTSHWIPQKLVHPALYQGEYSGKYLTCRPPVY